MIDLSMLLLIILIMSFIILRQYVLAESLQLSINNGKPWSKAAFSSSSIFSIIIPYIFSTISISISASLLFFSYSSDFTLIIHLLILLSFLSLFFSLFSPLFSLIILHFFIVTTVLLESTLIIQPNQLFFASNLLIYHVYEPAMHLSCYQAFSTVFMCIYSILSINMHEPITLH